MIDWLVREWLFYRLWLRQKFTGNMFRSSAIRQMLLVDILKYSSEIRSAGNPYIMPYSGGGWVFGVVYSCGYRITMRFEEREELELFLSKDFLPAFASMVAQSRKVLRLTWDDLCKDGERINELDEQVINQRC